MNRKFLEAIRIIFTIIVIILSIITIAMIITMLLGYSPTEAAMTFSVAGILTALQIIIISVLFQIKGDVGSLKEFKRESVEFKRQTIDKIKEIESKI